MPKNVSRINLFLDYIPEDIKETENPQKNQRNVRLQQYSGCTSFQTLLSQQNLSSAVEPIPEKPFISLVTRPTKHLKKESRLNNNMKRKLDQTNGSNDNLFSQPSSNHKSFNNFHNDESGCNNSSLLNNSQTPDFNFEFKKKLFNGTEARELFTFDKEKTKLFDFSQ